MVYILTLKQDAFILDLFYAGVCLRKITRLFRSNYGFPISAATIFRRILHWVPKADEALSYYLERGELGEFRFGDIWEIDETYLKLKKGELALIIVRDLKTGFDLGTNITYPVTAEAVKVALENAKATAKKCPLELRCDGLSVYDAPVKEVFENSTILSVHKRIKKAGQNQAIEGHNGGFKGRFNAMKSIHSGEKSPIIIKGWVLDYNWVNLSPGLCDMTPAEVATERKSIDGNHSWLTLLELAVRYSKEVLSSREPDRRFNGEEKRRGQSLLDPFLS